MSSTCWMPETPSRSPSASATFFACAPSPDCAPRPTMKPAGPWAFRWRPPNCGPRQTKRPAREEPTDEHSALSGRDRHRRAAAPRSAPTLPRPAQRPAAAAGAGPPGPPPLPPRRPPAGRAGVPQPRQRSRRDNGPCHASASPRRLAVLVEGLSLHQPPRPIERLGPAVTAAFDAEGKPTRAAEGFARSNSVAVDQLERVTTDKGERLAFRTTEAGQSARELLPQLVAAALDQLPIDRRMRWGASREEFVRPVHWLVMLLGDDIVPARILGVESGRLSRGHRFHSAEPFTLSRPDDYARVLAEEHHVLADFAQRRDRIREQVTAEADRLQGRALLDEALLDEVTALVEWPVVLSGSFDARFLEVPAEALISSMQEHQRYYPVVDDEGNLLPHFIFVANIDSQDPAQVIQGNERVIRPRLADAAFFYDTDRRSPLADRREDRKS